MIKDTRRTRIPSSPHRISDITAVTAATKAKYALFPVWVLSTSWQGNNYIFAMNGQTGKFVGNLPVDKVAARKWTLGLTAAVGAASYAVMWLLWLAGIL